VSSLKIKIKERYVKYITQSGWKKVKAPLYDRFFHSNYRAMRFLLAELYQFPVREEEKTIVPFEAFQDKVNLPQTRLPTIAFIAGPPLNFPYNLRNSSLVFIYWGESQFLTLRNADSTEKQRLNQLIIDIEILLPQIYERINLMKDFEGARKIFNNYYGIEEIKIPQKETEIVSKVETIKEKVETKPRGILSLEKVSRPVEIVVQDEIVAPNKEEVSKTEKGEEVMELKSLENKFIGIEEMETAINEFHKNRYDPNNFEEHVLVRMAYERTRMGLRTQREKGIKLYYLYIKRGCKRDYLGNELFSQLNKLANQIEADLLKPRP
jgi:hypothetical protein